MKKLTLSLMLVAFALAPALQAGEGPDCAKNKATCAEKAACPASAKACSASAQECNASAKACCATASSPKKAYTKNVKHALKGAQLLVMR
jgi:hypothetical protein